MPFSSSPSSASGNALISNNITQASHGFVVGDWVYYTGTAYAKADADLAISSDSVGVVTTIVDASTFKITLEGYVTGLTGLTAGTRYYLSTTAGALSAAPPTNNIKAVFIADSTTSGFVQQYAVGASSQAITYGRVRANVTLPTLSYSTTGVGTAINFDSTLYSSGMTFSGTNGITPSVAGRYRAEWFAMVASGEVNGDGIFKIVQNGVSLGQVYINMMEAAGVNQIAPFIDVDLVAGLPVTLNYQASVADSIPFEVGSYFQLSQLPTSVSVVVDAVAEYGETVIAPLTSTTGSASFVDVPGSSFTLPSAGTYEVFYYLPSFTSASNRAEAQIYTSADVVVADTGSVINGTSGTGGSNIPLMNTARIITTSSATYKLKWLTSGGTLSMSSSSTGDLTPKITWKKISGFLPSSGQTVDAVSVNLITTNQSIPAVNTDVLFNTIAFGNIPYSTSTGVFNLIAGKTYELEATLKSRATVAGYIQYEWVDATTSVAITGGINGVDMHATSTLAEGSSARAYLMYTPSTNQTVKVRVTGISGTAILLDAQRCNANIKQIGSTSNTVGTLSAIDQSSGGYFDIGNMRLQWGTHNDGNVDTTTVTLPIAFANTSYSVTATSNTSAGSLCTETKTTTSFDIDRASTTITTQEYSWFAIGMKV